MPTPSDAVRSAPGPATALPATRPSRHQPRLQARQKTEVVVAATVAAILLLLLAFILLFGRNGVVTQALHLDWSIYGFTGIVVSQVFTFLPQAYILLANVLGNIDVSLEEAAENLGAGPLTTLRRVTLSLARPGLASAALIVFILCMTDFGNPILIGGRYNVLATEIYAQVIGMSNFAAGSAMSAVLIVPCLVAYLVNACWVGSRSYVTVSAGAR